MRCPVFWTGLEFLENLVFTFMTMPGCSVLMAFPTPISITKPNFLFSRQNLFAKSKPFKREFRMCSNGGQTNAFSTLNL